MKKSQPNIYEELSNIKIEASCKTVKKSEIFGKNTFNEVTMKNYVSEDALDCYCEFLRGTGKISHEALQDIANGMLKWALDNNATHYTHWFQPLTGSVAEKHDAFLDVNPINGEIIEKFTWKNLIKQEPDASSFPHGCIRSTYEARGYTAWDPSSKVFLFGSTMCIPSVFISHSGHALDYKIPLLKAESSLNKYATEVAKLFDSEVSNVFTMLGWEQEFFLVKEDLVTRRPDIEVTNKTLVGASSVKGQKMHDHYFGSIRKRALEFIKTVEDECVLLGIPIKTRHNEVAPNQYELAHVYEKVNVAIDHNSLLIDVMNKVAYKQGLKVLLHEKPFQGVNGSGKHSNFSFVTCDGTNLLDQGKTFEEKMRFLTFLINIVQAISDHEELLRSTVATAGNDYRLGGCEAPPAIMSIYLGEEISRTLEEVKKSDKFSELCHDKNEDVYLSVINKIPEFLSEKCDRNRTSPIAFTGNKFEFRAVGSDQSCANPMITLISAVANQLKNFIEDLKKTKAERNLSEIDAMFFVLKGYLNSSERIIFNGDGYSPEWIEEAKSRGLSNKKNTAESLKDKISENSVKLFTSLHVFSKEEIFSRYIIEMECYSKKLEIEAKSLQEIVMTYILPDAIKYQNILLDNHKKLKENGFEPEFSIYQPETIKNISYNVTSIYALLKKLKKGINDLESEEDFEKKAEIAAGFSSDLFVQIRKHTDELEGLVDNGSWSLVKYSEFFRAL